MILRIRNSEFGIRNDGLVPGAGNPKSGIRNPKMANRLNP
jgi:hypothetical protein